MNTEAVKVGELYFLLHPGEEEFSGYGLTMGAGSVKRLVGILMVDRPHRASPTWLAEIERTYGGYELYRMTARGERGIACQMWVADDSLAHIRPLVGNFTHNLQVALFPWLLVRPTVQLLVAWDENSRVWRSEFYQPAVVQVEAKPAPPAWEFRFPLGRVVATPAALAALEEAGQLPQEFLQRHLACDWGELDEHDRQLNVEAVRYGGRLLSAYTTKTGMRIWIITEADRSATTILLPADY